MQRTSGTQWLLLAPCATLGLAYPDLDLLLPRLLGHRSVLTHSLLLPAFLLGSSLLLRRLMGDRWSSRRITAFRALSWVFGWFLLGLAIHLTADLWPRSWQGYALAKVPNLPLGSGTHQLSANVTQAWLWANTVTAVLLIEWLLYLEPSKVTKLRHAASVAVLTPYILINEQKPDLLLRALVGWVVLVILARLTARIRQRMRIGQQLVDGAQPHAQR